jgi:hypothetical protein
MPGSEDRTHATHWVPRPGNALKEPTNIAKTTRAIGAEPQRALPILGINHQLNPSGT